MLVTKLCHKIFQLEYLYNILNVLIFSYNIKYILYFDIRI
jgi:hypothetical protein